MFRTEDFDEDAILSSEDEVEQSKASIKRNLEEESAEESEEESNEDINDANAQLKVLSADALKRFNARLEKTGVVYLSRIPPFMKPQKMRSLLSRYGEIGRIYLSPEDAKIAARRRKYKHNKRQNYCEGWVEFMDKSVARATAQMLNNTIIGGKKRSFYHDDIWNVKYLPRFKWDHLTEQLAYELKVREQRMRTEIAQAKRENSIYLKNVAKAKMIDAMQEKKKLKDIEPSSSTVSRQFKQRRVVESATSFEKKKILSKLFA